MTQETLKDGLTLPDPYIVPDATRALNTRFYGPEGSRLTLPVVDDAGRVFAEESPVPGT